METSSLTRYLWDLMTLFIPYQPNRSKIESSATHQMYSHFDEDEITEINQMWPNGWNKPRWLGFGASVYKFNAMDIFITTQIILCWFGHGIFSIGAHLFYDYYVVFARKSQDITLLIVRRNHPLDITKSLVSISCTIQCNPNCIHEDVTGMNALNCLKYARNLAWMSNIFTKLSHKYHLIINFVWLNTLSMSPVLISLNVIFKFQL